MNQLRCATCNKTDQWLKEHADSYECSHVDCPMRRRVVGLSKTYVKGLQWKNPFEVSQASSVYKSTPTTKD